MMHNLTTGWVTITDLEFLRTTGHVHLSESILRRKIEWHEVAVAAIDDSLVGFLYLDYLWSTIPFIATIWVLEAHRQHGAGRALLQFVEMDARAQGQNMLYSSSQLDEAPPHAWHRHMGFEECGMLAGHNDDVGEVFLRKRL